MGWLWAAAAAAVDVIVWAVKAIDAFFTAVDKYVTPFLDRIHFDTLMRINRLAEIVSADYREMMNKVYAEISDFSNAIGFGPYGLAVFIENARQVVLDTSAMAGNRYDIGQVYWVADLQRLLTKIHVTSSAISRNPLILFQHFDELIREKRVNEAAETARWLRLDIDNIINRADIVVTALGTVTQDLRKLNQDLPSSIRSAIGPMLEGILGPFDDWKRDVYDPYRDDLKTSLRVLGQRSNMLEGFAVHITDRLKKPGDLVKDVDLLPLEEKERQEDLISDVASRTFGREVSRVSSFVGTARSELDAVSRLLRATPEPVTWLTLEPPEVLGLSGASKSPHKTWFPGDY